MFLTLTVAIITFVSTSLAGHLCPPKEKLGSCSCWYGDVNPESISSTPFTTPSYTTPPPPTTSPYWRYSTEYILSWRSSSRPDWRSSSHPDWRSSYVPDWRSSSRPEWRSSSRPEWRSSSRPEWRSSSRPEWRSSSQPDWRYSSHPDWIYSSQPDWRIGSQKLFRGYLPITVVCNASSSLIALEEVLALGFYRKIIDKLVVSRVPPKQEHKLSVLPNKWLRYTRVKILEIEDTILSGDFIALGEPFQGQEQSLLWITARRCSLYGALTNDTRDTINTNGLNCLIYLEGLDLSFNYLTTVSNTAFRSPPANLTTLNLSYNSLKTLDSMCFYYINKLKYIDLSHNLLESLTRLMFPSNAKLEYVDLSWNFLKSIPSDLFSNMAVLKIVKLEKNFLVSMPANTWNNAWKNLEFVNVTGNFIRCDCDLRWILSLITERFSPGNGPLVYGNCTKDTLRDTEQHPISSLRPDHLAC